MNLTTLFLPFSMIFSLLTDTYIGDNYLVLYNLRGSQNSTDDVDDFFYGIYKGTDEFYSAYIDDDYIDGDSDIVI